VHFHGATFLALNEETQKQNNNKGKMSELTLKRTRSGSLKKDAKHQHQHHLWVCHRAQTPRCTFQDPSSILSHQQSFLTREECDRKCMSVIPTLSRFLPSYGTPQIGAINKLASEQKVSLNQLLEELKLSRQAMEGLSQEMKKLIVARKSGAPLTYILKEATQKNLPIDQLLMFSDNIVDPAVIAALKDPLVRFILTQVEQDRKLSAPIQTARAFLKVNFLSHLSPDVLWWRDVLQKLFPWLHLNPDAQDYFRSMDWNTLRYKTLLADSLYPLGVSDDQKWILILLGEYDVEDKKEEKEARSFMSAILKSQFPLLPVARYADEKERRLLVRMLEANGSQIRNLFSGQGQREAYNGALRAIDIDPYRHVIMLLYSST
jgi:hypothetical protein